MDYELETRKNLAAVYRLLHHFGWDDLIYTHASAKIPGTSNYLINSFGVTFDEVTASNLVKVDIDGNVHGEGTINPAGFLIHSAIHKARPDVGGIVHTHTNEGVAVSADKDGLWPISQKASVILNSLGYHDYQGIVIDSSEEESLKNDLGNNNYLILRNHGLLTVGKNAPHAFLNMRTLQKACEVQVLCEYDRTIKLSETLIKENLDNSIKFRQGMPKTTSHWDALLRIVKKNYPDYEN